MADEKDADTARKPKRLGYLGESRSLSLSIVAIFPLAIAYQCGIVVSGYAVRNLAEVWLQGPLAFFGVNSMHMVNVLLIVGLIAALLRLDKSAAPQMMFVLLMIFEATLYAMVLHRAGWYLSEIIVEHAGGIPVWAAGLPWPDLLLGLGAGVYEELVFRLLILGGICFAFHHVFKWPYVVAGLLGLAFSSLLFSFAHHIGPMGEDFETFTFTFRAVCGVILGTVFLVRGLGVAVWTHAIYNSMVILSMMRAGA
jgi:hypothetical protein